MRKRILAIVLCCFMAVGVCACGKTTDTVKEAKDQQEINQKTFNKSIEAFKEFYSDFYEEHRDADAIVDGICWDCQGRIIIDNENTPLMAICDFIVSGDEVSPDIYLFEYNGEEVVKKASINGMLWDSDDGFTIYCIEDEIYVGDMDGAYAYRVEDEYMIQLDTEYSDDEENIKGFVTGLGENGLGASYLLNDSLEVRGTDFIYSERALGKGISMSGTDFELFLKNLMEADIQNDLDLRFYYSNYYLEKGFVDEKSDYDAGVLAWEDGIYYRLYEDGTAAVLGVDTGYENVSIPDSVMGYVVNKVGCTYTGYDGEFGETEETACFLVSDATTVKIPQSVSDVYIEGTESIVVLEGTVNVCIKNGKVKYLQIPDSVTNLDINASDVSTIFCNEGSYAQQYAEDNGIPYVIGTIEDNKNDTPITPVSYTIENEVLPAYEEYIKEHCGELNGCELIYIDDDDIPECVYLDMSWEMLLCYDGGAVKCCSSGFGGNAHVAYRERTGEFEIGGIAGSQEYDEFYTLEAGVFSLVGSAYHSNYVGYEGEDTDEYCIEDNNVSKGEYETYVDSFGTYEWVTCEYSSISEAYQNIGKAIFSTYEAYVTKFELTDNILTVETEDGKSLSYPVSEECKWEETAFEEILSTMTYEEFKTEIESAREIYLRIQELNSPSELYIEIQDGVIVRVYNQHV